MNNKDLKTYKLSVCSACRILILQEKKKLSEAILIDQSH